MNKNGLNEALKPFFEELNVNELSMTYDERLNCFISEGFLLDEMEYLMKIDLFNTAGTVSIGYTDGLKFYRTKILGQILFNGEKWETV